ncbi:hypothetical protein [Aeromicrobium sp. UC242_57]|uniref:hypothetical protein n=1 Tax=Aeromicrobium sp. UC242_57 TaxID=3374624 RepID=UPI0037BB322F
MSRCHDGERMRVKGHCNDRQITGKLAGALHDMLVSSVHTVEVAHRHSRGIDAGAVEAPRMSRQIVTEKLCHTVLGGRRRAEPKNVLIASSSPAGP